MSEPESEHCPIQATFTIELSHAAAHLVDELRLTGLYGATYEEVIMTLLLSALRKENETLSRTAAEDARADMLESMTGMAERVTEVAIRQLDPDLMRPKAKPPEA